jgi:hypothetical protein
LNVALLIPLVLVSLIAGMLCVICTKKADERAQAEAEASAKKVDGAVFQSVPDEDGGTDRMARV